MIDPRLLRESPDALRAAQERRGESAGLIDDLIAADEARRAAIASFEAVRSEQKELGKKIPKAVGDEKSALLARTKELSAEVKVAEVAKTETVKTFDELLRALQR